MTLHTLNKHRLDLVHLCLSALAPGDSLLLLEDGVYAAFGKTAELFGVHELPAGVSLFVLMEDIVTRGASDKLPAEFTLVTYRDFVSLSLRCSKVVNWN